MILFATIISSTFPFSFRRQIDLNDYGESLSFFRGLSTMTKLATFQSFGNELVQGHLFRNVVSFSMSSRRIIPSTPSEPETVFFLLIFLIARASSSYVIGGVAG